MADLSHWDVAIEFSGNEAFSLIFGFEPNVNVSEEGKSQPLLTRMKSCYKNALEYERWRSQDEPPLTVIPTDQPTNLRSIELIELTVKKANSAEFSSNSLRYFEIQKFSRIELARWIECIKLSSKYDFAPHAKTVSLSIEGKDLNSRKHEGIEKRKRLHYLDSVIKIAQKECADGEETTLVFAKLREMAVSKRHGLIGVTDKGIQYTDAKDQTKEYSKISLTAYLNKSNVKRKRLSKSA